ncbi:MAG: GNAT family N-acetyltransferase [Candidatus Diapherotrites archaeon]
MHPTPAKIEDTSSIVQFIQRYFPYTTIDEQEVKHRIQSNGFIFNKIMQNKKIIGYAEWEMVEEKKETIRLNGIAVLPEYQQKGNGTMLLQEGEKEAKKRGIKKIQLYVGETNMPAKQAYAKNGYAYTRPHLRKINGEKAEVWEKKIV